MYIQKKWSGEKLGDNCYSNTFKWTDGKEYPEIGGYKWMTLQEVINRGGVKAYYTLFNSIANKNDIDCNETELTYQSTYINDVLN